MQRQATLRHQGHPQVGAAAHHPGRRTAPASEGAGVISASARLARWPKNVFFASDFIAKTAAYNSVRQRARKSGRGLSGDRTTRSNSQRKHAVQAKRRQHEAEPSVMDVAENTARRAGNATDRCSTAGVETGAEWRRSDIEDTVGDNRHSPPQQEPEVQETIGDRNFLQGAASAVLCLHSRFFRGVESNRELMIVRLCTLCREAGWMGNTSAAESAGSERIQIDPFFLEEILGLHLDEARGSREQNPQGSAWTAQPVGILTFEDFYGILADIAAVVYPHDAAEPCHSRSERAMHRLLLGGVFPLASERTPRAWLLRPEVLYGRPALAALRMQRQALHRLFSIYSEKGSTSRRCTSLVGRNSFLLMLKDLSKGSAGRGVSEFQAISVFNAVVQNGQTVDAQVINGGVYERDETGESNGDEQRGALCESRSQREEKAITPLQENSRLCWSLFLEAMAALAVMAVQDLRGRTRGIGTRTKFNTIRSSTPADRDVNTANETTYQSDGQHSVYQTIFPPGTAPSHTSFGSLFVATRGFSDAETARHHPGTDDCENDTLAPSQVIADGRSGRLEKGARGKTGSVDSSATLASRMAVGCNVALDTPGFHDAPSLGQCGASIPPLQEEYQRRGVRTTQATRIATGRVPQNPPVCEDAQGSLRPQAQSPEQWVTFSQRPLQDERSWRETCQSGHTLGSCDSRIIKAGGAIGNATDRQGSKTDLEGSQAVAIPRIPVRTVPVSPIASATPLAKQQPSHSLLIGRHLVRMITDSKSRTGTATATPSHHQYVSDFNKGMNTPSAGDQAISQTVATPCTIDIKASHLSDASPTFSRANFSPINEAVETPATSSEILVGRASSAELVFAAGVAMGRGVTLEGEDNCAQRRMSTGSGRGEMDATSFEPLQPAIARTAECAGLKNNNSPAKYCHHDGTPSAMLISTVPSTALLAAEAASLSIHNGDYKDLVELPAPCHGNLRSAKPKMPLLSTTVSNDRVTGRACAGLRVPSDGNNYAAVEHAASFSVTSAGEGGVADLADTGTGTWAVFDNDQNNVRHGCDTEEPRNVRDKSGIEGAKPKEAKLVVDDGGAAAVLPDNLSAQTATTIRAQNDIPRSQLRTVEFIYNGAGANDVSRRTERETVHTHNPAAHETPNQGEGTSLPQPRQIENAVRPAVAGGKGGIGRTMCGNLEANAEQVLVDDGGRESSPTAEAGACSAGLFEELLDPEVVSVYSRCQTEFTALFCKYRNQKMDVDGNKNSGLQRVLSGNGSKEPSGWISYESVRKFVSDFPVLTKLWGNRDVDLRRLLRASRGRQWRKGNAASGCSTTDGSGLELGYVGFLEVLTRMAHASDGGAPLRQKLSALLAALHADTNEELLPTTTTSTTATSPNRGTIA